MTATAFKYNMNPTELGIDMSEDAQMKWCLNRAAKRSTRLSQREFAASLLKQFGRWSDKQRAWAGAFYCARIGEYGMCLSEECRNRSVRKFIAEVGTDSALAHASRLREEAKVMLSRVSDGKEYADTHDGYSDRQWKSLEAAAADKTEIADRIVRIASAA